MTTFKGFASLVLAATIASTLSAETHCPGNVASLPFRLVNHHQIIVSVSINQTGPYSFLVDTGAETTEIDPALASELHLKVHGATKIEGVGFEASVSYAQVDLLEAGSHAVINQNVLVYELSNLQSAGLSIRGILGEDVLEHFDVLIDNAHNLLCLDDSGAMRTAVKGQHIALVAPAPAADGVAARHSLIVVARLSDGTRPVRLWLDSGSNVPFLYNPSGYLAQRASQSAPLQGIGANAAQQSFSALAPQDVKIGSLELSNVSFIAPMGSKKNSKIAEFDGLLATELFRRVFIDHADHFAVLEPW